MNVIGKNVAIEILNNNQKIYKAYIYENFSDKKIINELQKRNIEIKYMSKFELDKIDNGNHQGIILSIPDFEYSDLDELLTKENPFVVILDHLEDPHNFGAIIRTCESAGVDGIIIPKDRSVEVNSTVMKTSAGALNNMKICSVTNLNNTIRELKKKGLWVIGADMDGEKSYYEMNYNMPIALVIGSEGFGISRLVKESCDIVVNIPMKGKVNSLNASVAAGILIYKIIESRK
jgi:23S rRNA (guanosine2251-2'-O)-methyltransferase